jgi:hypothetical protein
MRNYHPPVRKTGEGAGIPNSEFRIHNSEFLLLGQRLPLTEK